jgi:DegV family protein with EDD domain
MSYQIITDSCSDLPAGYGGEHGVLIIPMTFMLDGMEYQDDGWRSISVEEFYSRVRKGSMPTTSLVNVQRFLDIFTPLLEEGKDIVYIAFSSALSGTCQNGMIAASDLRERFPERKITVIDSLCASGGLGMLIRYAQTMKEAGASYEDLVAWVEANKLRAIHWFTVDNLNHLRRGGRLSGASALIGSVLSIKPVLHVNNEGRLIPVEKVKGRRHALRSLVDQMEKSVFDSGNQVIYIHHGDAVEDAESVAAMIRERMAVCDIEIHPIGPVIGSHSGPGTLALFYMGTVRRPQ